ncbi:mCG148078 [Mus musculus]|jgi:hypothetical protein|nr:mCG148078 [Mus musculus]
MCVVVHMWRSEQLAGSVLSFYHVRPRGRIELRLSNLTASAISLTLFQVFVLRKCLFLKLGHALNSGDPPASASLVLGF